MPTDPAQPMIDWIVNTPPAALAVELMAAFGPEGIRGGDAVGPADLGDKDAVRQRVRDRTGL